MGDFQSTFLLSPPPSPSSSDKSIMPISYYGLVIVAIVAITLALYNIIILKRSRQRGMQSQPHEGANMESRIENWQRNHMVLSSFKYKQEEDGKEENELCAVCLSGFEEGEEVRKLPRCKHYFHAPCIDTWLYSHFDCPICRTSVGPFCRRFLPENQNSPPPGFLESGGGGGSL